MSVPGSSNLEFDLVVIGSGPGGQKAALQGAKAGKRVAIIERDTCVGGGCMQTGTLPSKSFRESVYRWSLGSQGTLGQELFDAGSLPARRFEQPEMIRLLRRRDRVVAGEAAVVSDQLRRNDVEIFQGTATLVSPNEVRVTPAADAPFVLRAQVIIIATGARPISPPHLATDGVRVVDSDSILTLSKVPRSMAVLGGGIIGCEYASMFVMAGTEVHLVDRRHEVLASVDREIANHLVERFNQQGLKLHLSTEATLLERLPADAGVRVHLANGTRIEVDVVLVALGRVGNSEELGLQNVGLKPTDRGLIEVDAHYRTAVPNIYAVGDVVGAPALASTSMEQGRVACCHAFGLEAGDISALFPYGIYTIPEISMVGPHEEELRAKGVDYVAGKARYRELARGQIVGDQWGLLKLLVCRKSLKLLGVHIVGDNAAELVHIGQAVMAFGGDVRYFIRSVFNYPTLAEAYKTAAFHAVNQIHGKTRSK